MAMAAAKATEEANKYKGIAKAAMETIKNIIQAVGALKFNFKGDLQPVGNLTPEQDILITAIRRHGIEISKSYGYTKLAEEMKKVTLGKPMSELLHAQEKEYQDRNKPSILDAITQKPMEQNEQSHNAPSVNRGRKNRGDER